MRTLTSVDHGAQVTVEPEEAVEIRLPQLGGTGFVWSVASSSNVIVAKDQLEAGADPQPPGEAATRVFQVRLAGAGRGFLQLVRSRPWEAADHRDAAFEISLVPGGQ